jgi:hypothetical protein
MADAATTQLERVALHTDPGTLPMLFRVALWGIGGLTLLYGLLRGQVSTSIAAVVFLLAGWVLGRFGAGGTIVDRTRRELTQWSTYGGKRASQTVSLADGQRVIIRSETKGQMRGRPSYTTYHIFVVRQRGEALIWTNASAIGAREQAQQIALVPGIPFSGEIERG